MEFKPGAPSIVYLCGAQGKFARSVNGGGNWTLVSFSSLTPSNIGRSCLAVCPARPEGVYALMAQNPAPYFRLVRSTDSGISFATRTGDVDLPDVYIGQQGWYDLALAVDPANFDMVYAAEVVPLKSSDGGASWTSVRQGSVSGLTHVDIHSMEFRGSTLYCASDGGLHRTSDSGATWVDLSKRLQIGQVYSLGAPATLRLPIYAGLQDNGLDVKTASGWSQQSIGDIMQVVAHPTDPQICYLARQSGSLSATTSGWASSVTITPPSTGENATWETPLLMHPAAPDTLWTGRSNVWKTTNRGAAWTKISNFSGTDTIGRLAVSAADPGVLFSVRGGLTLHRTANGGASWVNVTSTLPVGSQQLNGSFVYLQITAVETSSLDPLKAWVGLSGYVSGHRVYRTVDGGATWQNASDGLPDLPVRCFASDSQTGSLYAGMDVGVYALLPGATVWQAFRQGLPNAPLSQLMVHPASRRLRAATYGRGVWEANLAGAPSILVQPSLTASSGGVASLAVSTQGTGVLTYRWYAGLEGDTSRPAGGGSSPTLTLAAPAMNGNPFWVRVFGASGLFTDSAAVTPQFALQPSTYATWKQAFYGANPVSDTSDSDGDGLPLVMEYLAGGTPTVMDQERVTATARRASRESFDYSPGTPGSLAGGRGFTGPWTLPASALVVPGLSLPGLTVSGSALEIRPGTASRQWASNPEASDVWMSCLFRVPSASSNGYSLSIRLLSGGSKQWEIYRIENGNYVNHCGNVGQGCVPRGFAVATLTNSSAHRLIVHLRRGPLALDDSIEAWVDPTPGATLPAPQGQGGGYEFNPIDGIDVNVNPDTNPDFRLIMDEIRLGYSWPEISTDAQRLSIAFTLSETVQTGTCVLQYSANARNWTDMARYTRTAGAWVRDSSNLSFPLSNATRGGLTWITETDAAAMQGTRLYRLKGSTP